ncbi:MAG: YitT family protein [Clostridia bacterium]|nr:YitT family protein [Clostridia bacterium]
MKNDEKIKTEDLSQDNKARTEKTFETHKREYRAELDDLPSPAEKKRLALDVLKRYIFMILGCVSYALSLRMFLIPLKIVGGGVSGAASLIEILTAIPAGYFILAINLPILIMGFKLMGWRFILRCLITTASLSAFTNLFGIAFFDFLQGLTESPLLASLYGGILQGIGIGLFIKFEMSSGGTELLGRITHHVLPVFSIAVHAAFFDGLVVIIGAIVLKNPENVLYALILIFVSAKVSDVIVLGLNKAKLCYVITTKGEEISEFLIHHSPRGVTLLHGEGMYSKTEKGVLLTCVKNHQIQSLKTAVKSIDENSFVIVAEATEVYGKGFHRI